MHMYIGNATKQHQNIHYRVPEAVQARQQTIPIGGQVKIEGDLSQPAINGIIEQLKKYGLIAVDDIKGSRGFAPMCYSIGSAINPLMIKLLADRNSGVLNHRGSEQRKEMAIAMASTIGQNAAENGVGDSLEQVSVDTVEEDNVDARTRQTMTGEARVMERTVVTPEGKQPHNPDSRNQKTSGKSGKKNR